MAKHIPRLYYEQALKSDARILLHKQQAHHLYNVLRKKTGDNIIIFNENNGAFNATIIGDKHNPTCFVQAQIQAPSSMPDISLAFALLQSQKHHIIIEKATELGVKNLLPFISDYTQVAKKNVESIHNKMTKIATQASEQCGRLTIPYISDITSYAAIIDKARNSPIFLCAESGEAAPLYNQAQGHNAKNSIIIIGPEGGFSPHELALANNYDLCYKMSLGGTILKADTAAITALSIWLCANNWLDSRPPHHI